MTLLPESNAPNLNVTTSLGITPQTPSAGTALPTSFAPSMESIGNGLNIQFNASLFALIAAGLVAFYLLKGK